MSNNKIALNYCVVFTGYEIITATVYGYKQVQSTQCINLIKN